MPRKRHERYSVTGPGLADISYADVGPAISRSLTAANASEEDATFYVRDLDGTILGYSERNDRIVTTVRYGKRQAAIVA